jgi:hypothetical protein
VGEGEIWEMGGNFGNKCEMLTTRVFNLFLKRRKRMTHRKKDGKGTKESLMYSISLQKDHKSICSEVVKISANFD